MSSKTTMHGTDLAGVTAAAIAANAVLARILALPSPQDRYRALSDLYLASSHLGRAALREVAFSRLCGFVIDWPPP